MPWDIKERDGKFCVVKKGESDPIKCHATRNEALRHQRALYASETGGMNKYNVLDVGKIFSDPVDGDENTRWVQAWKYTKINHPVYGEIEITPEVGRKFKEHFDARTYGQDLSVNFSHGLDPAKGRQAGGWVKDIEPRENGVFYLVTFTEDAMKEIKEGKWRYLSPEFDDWEDPETGIVHENVPMGLALDNRPFFKNMAPLNFSEFDIDINTPIGEWSDKLEGTTSEGNDSMNEELFKKFCEVLGIELPEKLDDEEALLGKAKEFSEVVKPLMKIKEDSEKRKEFRDLFPQEYAELLESKAARLENDARRFSENYARFSKTEDDQVIKLETGFSSLAQQAIEEAHKKFAEGTGTVEDLKTLVDTLATPDAIVDYKEQGTSRQTERDAAGVVGTGNVRKDFNEIVEEIAVKDEIPFEKALGLAAERHPQMFSEYMGSSLRV